MKTPIMTTSVDVDDQKHASELTQNHESYSSYCTLQWRQNQLLVQPPQNLKQPYIKSVNDLDLLTECLKRSPVSLVRIDPQLGKTKVLFWAEASYQASKKIFLRIPSDSCSDKGDLWLLKFLKRSVEWVAALIILTALSPSMLILLGMLWLESPEELFEKEWRVGERGRLFRAFKFKVLIQKYSESDCNGLKTKKNSSSVRYWIEKHSLTNLPQLFNVIRGEMSLIGSRCWSLEDAVRLNGKARKELNKLPGMIILKEVKTESNLLHLDGQTL